MTVVLPEYRQIELYSKKKALPVVEDEAAEQEAAKAAVARLASAFTTLDAALGDPVDNGDPMAGWAKYRVLPRNTPVEKLTAETYRALRVFQVATIHPSARIEVKSGLVKAGATVDHTALSIRITHAGMDLLASLAAYRLAETTGIYPEPYVEAMLCRYWADIATEIRWYYDEDRVLFQYRDRLHLNRHFRFDCDNPRHTMAGGVLRFDVGATYRDPLRFPIDFFVTSGDHLHIIPVEALSDYALSAEDLPCWRARLADGVTLPAAFRSRFTREDMVPGLPMT